MSAFSYEIASVHEAVKRAYPSSSEGIYAIPWYLVIGEPGSGRSAAIHAMNLTWKGGDGPLQIGVPQQLCTYWMPNEAVFIEPESAVLGPRRGDGNLRALCEELHTARPREPIDGILLVLGITDFIDLDENGVEAYANRIRGYLVEIGKRLHADVPTYVVLTRYDTVWGFADVFSWSPERAREDPWGFTLPANTPSQAALPRIREELVGLNARMESFCLAKLSGEDPPEQRIRAFQHLAEIRNLMEKLRQVFGTIAMANSFERAPWIRAVALGSAVPGTGDRLRAGVQRFYNMGLQQVAMAPGSMRPGGLPLVAYMKSVVLPERELVPLRTRWRDDRLIRWLLILGIVLWVGTIATIIVFIALAHR